MKQCRYDSVALLKTQSNNGGKEISLKRNVNERVSGKAELQRSTQIRIFSVGTFLP
jgi:hypothetical protein